MKITSVDFKRDPIQQFLELLQQAQDLNVPEPIAMSLATVVDDQASVRIVLFKGMLRGGFSFYTNYNGAKAQALDKNPKVAATFFWQQLAQQIRIEGVAERATREESVAYFNTRPRLSQIGAWASDQSKEIPNFEYLADRVKQFEKKFENQNVPCPENWGGYRIVPNKMEFWFGREGRLHERFVFEKSGSLWSTKRLSP